MARRRGRIVILPGEIGKLCLYINNTNYSTHLHTWNVKKRLNQLSTFSATLLDIGDTEKSDVDEGKEVQFTADDFLVLKGTIEKVRHSSDYVTTIEGYCQGRVLMRYLTGRAEYLHTNSSTIVNTILSQNNDGASPWIMEPGTNTNYGIVSLRVEYDNKLKVLDSLAKSLGYDWYISHSGDRKTDYFNIVPERGSGPNNIVYTFNPTSGGNAFYVDQQMDKDNLINCCDMLGFGSGEEQLHCKYYHASVNRTALTYGDTFLDGDLSSDATTITVRDTSGFPSNGTIQIELEQIAYTGKTDTSFTGCTRGANSTNAVSHTSGEDVINLSGTLLVDSTAGFPSSGRVRVGEEEITYTGTTSTSLTGCSRVPVVNSTATSGTSTTLSDTSQSWLTNEWTGGNISITGGTGAGQTRNVISNTDTSLTVSAWTTTPDSTSIYSLTRKVYAHEKGIHVYVVYDGTNTWSIYNPQAGSSIYDNGLYHAVETDVSLRTQNAVDRVAQNIVTDKKDVIKRIVLAPTEVVETLKAVSIGDYITLTDAQSDLSGDYRVIGLECGMNEDGYEYVKFEVSNQPYNYVEEMEDTKKKVGDTSVYTPGTTIYYPFSIQTNLDNSTGAYIRIQIPDDVIAINDAKLSFFINKYRVDSTVSAGGSPHSHSIPSLNVNAVTSQESTERSNSDSVSGAGVSVVDVSPAPTVTGGYKTFVKAHIVKNVDTDTDIYVTVSNPNNDAVYGELMTINHTFDYIMFSFYAPYYGSGSDDKWELTITDGDGNDYLCDVVDMTVYVYGSHTHSITGATTASSTSLSENSHTHDLVNAITEEGSKPSITLRIAQGTYDADTAGSANWTTICSNESADQKDLDISSAISRGIHTLEFTASGIGRIEAWGYVIMKIKV